MQLTWQTVKIPIKDLKEFAINPRRISEKDFKRLVNDIKQDGYHRRILIDPTNTIIGGHSRKKALIAAGFSKNDEIEVLKASRPLTPDEFSRVNIRDNLHFGEFDTDILGNHFDLVQLVEWGMPPEFIGLDLSKDEPDAITNPVLEKELCFDCPHKGK